jgi:hypothetical protein
MGTDVRGWEATALLASTRDAAIYDCHKKSSPNPDDRNRGRAPAEAALMIVFRPFSVFEISLLLPKDHREITEWRDPSQPRNTAWTVMVVRGHERTAHLIHALWQRGRNAVGW